MTVSNPIELHYAIQLGLLFVLFVTKAYKKSFTTILFILSTTIFFFDFKECAMETHYFIVNLLSAVAVLRAMLHDDKDKIIRKNA